MSATDDALKILETPEAEGGLSDAEKILAATNVLRAPVVIPASEIAPASA